MIANTAEAAAASAAGVATASGKNEVDPEVFAKELESYLNEPEKTGQANTGNAATRAMEKLAAAFPNSVVTIFSENGAMPSSTTANISVTNEMLEQIADSDDLFNRLKDALEGLLEAARNQSLSNAGNSTPVRNITVSAAEIRYVETQRGSSGTTLSVTQLFLQHSQMESDTINTLLGLNKSGARSNLLSFDSFLSNTQSWQMQGFSSIQAMMQANTSSGSRSQGSFTSIEVVIKQWSESKGGTEVSGMDFMAYMEIMGLSDPLVLDLGDEGFNMTSPEDGVVFDIKGDGSPVQTSFISGNNAFLYLDQNGNGVVDDANELFGDHGGFSNGYEKLKQYDDNGDGVIDENDAIYSQLRLWRDLNGDGVNQLEESVALAQAGIKSINLNHDNSRELDRHGNVIADKSSFTRFDGTQGMVADVWLRSRKRQ